MKIRKINESPDEVWINNKLLVSWNDEDAITFGINPYTNEMGVVEHKNGFTFVHDDLFLDDNRLDDEKGLPKRNKLVYPGRLWVDKKIISFWEYPKPEEIKDVILKLEDAINDKWGIRGKYSFKIWDKGYQIEILKKSGNKENSYLIDLEDYEIMEDESSSHKYVDHIKSPLKKEKNVPYGFGSKNPKYKSLQYRQALYVESENVMKAKLVKESLYNFKRESDPIQSSGLGIKNLITKWLDDMGIYKYKINDDYTIDVYGDVHLENKNLLELPEYIQFNNVDDVFEIYGNKLITLRGCPRYVGLIFDCSENNLDTLEGCPKIVDANFVCYDNNVDFTTKYVRSLCKVGGKIKLK